MAKIEVTGYIRRVFYEGKGATVAEEYKSASGTKHREYTLWFEKPHGLDIGDHVTATGVLSANIDDWTNKEGQPILDDNGKQKRSVVLAVNGTRIVSSDHKEPAPIDQTDLPF